MLSRWLSTTALAISLLLVGSVHAAADEKTRLGNQTIDKTLHLRTHSIYPPYIDQDLQNRWWDFGADSYVNTNKHIRLTRKVPSQMGWLWSRLALTSANFVIEAEFKITGDSSHLYGDGMAMWLTKDRAQPGPVFGSKDEFTGLGIFLDTYANARHSYGFPRVVGMIGDGHTKYDYGNDGDGQEIGSCSANFRRTDVATKLKVTYVKNSFLDVKIQYKGWDDWTDCFYAEKVSLPSNPFVGFSAMTGDVADFHDIISVATHSVVVSAPENPPNKMTGKRLQSGSGSWTGLLFKVVLFVGVAAGGWYGFQEYKRRQRSTGFGGGGLGYSAPPPRSPMGGMSPMRSAGFGQDMYDNKRY